MDAKTFEIRDKGTFIPMLAVRLKPVTEEDRYLLARAGFGRTPEDQSEYVQLVRIDGGTGQSACDPYDWGNRTMQNAHKYIIENWAILQTGAVIDVEYILGESKQPKQSERVTVGAI